LAAALCQSLDQERHSVVHTSLLRHRNLLTRRQLHHLHAKHAPQLQLRLIEDILEPSAGTAEHLVADVGASDRLALQLTGKRKTNELLGHLVEVAVLVRANVAAVRVFVFGLALCRSWTLGRRLWRS
jgi:hypothetical protein